MSQCISCPVKVGCSCQLIGGRCSACHAAYIEALKQGK